MRSDTGSVQADYVSYTAREAERDLGIYYYRARYYDPLTGRFMARDPLGFSAGDVNLYRYVGNNPINLCDPSGLFEWGLRYGKDYRGHGDFYGYQVFDYIIEDADPATDPTNILGNYPVGAMRHFRNILDVENDLIDAIDNCDKDRFQRLLHQGQDYFTHYGKGYRWPTGHVWDSFIGRYFTGENPDRDEEAWVRANAWTMWWVNQWLRSNGLPR
jgi:RHS repeat-associated protein